MNLSIRIARGRGRSKQPASHRAGRGVGRRPGWLRWLALVLILGGVVGAVLGWPWLRDQSRVAAAYGAKVGCSCHYIAGRSLGDCTRDFEPGMSLVWLTENAETHTITARYALLPGQNASWRPGPGCVLEPWKD